MESMSLDISALTVETFAVSATAEAVEGPTPNGTISGCPTSRLCCD